MNIIQADQSIGEDVEDEEAIPSNARASHIRIWTGHHNICPTTNRGDFPRMPSPR